MMPQDAEEERRWKKVALILLPLVLVLLVIVTVWWINLADRDVEKGPVEPMEAITDSADDGRAARPRS